MAPEQVDGRDVDARADLFAFGAVIYEMVTGKRAFEGSGYARRRCQDPEGRGASPLECTPSECDSRDRSRHHRESIPPLLDHIIELSGEGSDDRWQTASDLKQALKWIGEGSTTSSPVLPVGMTTRRRYFPWAAAAVAVVVATVAVLAWIGSRDRRRRETTPPCSSRCIHRTARILACRRR